MEDEGENPQESKKMMEDIGAMEQKGEGDQRKREEI